MNKKKTYLAMAAVSMTQHFRRKIEAASLEKAKEKATALMGDGWEGWEEGDCDVDMVEAPCVSLDKS